VGSRGIVPRVKSHSPKRLSQIKREIYKKKIIIIYTHQKHKKEEMEEKKVKERKGEEGKKIRKKVYEKI
jgi:hypothetical protein